MGLGARGFCAIGRPLEPFRQSLYWSHRYIPPAFGSDLSCSSICTKSRGEELLCTSKATHLVARTLAASVFERAHFSTTRRPGHQRGSRRSLGGLPNFARLYNRPGLTRAPCFQANRMDTPPVPRARGGVGSLFLSLRGFNSLVGIPRVDAI